jgi:hypothetical protein
LARCWTFAVLKSRARPALLTCRTLHQPWWRSDRGLLRTRSTRPSRSSPYLNELGGIQYLLQSSARRAVGNRQDHDPQKLRRHHARCGQSRPPKPDRTPHYCVRGSRLLWVNPTWVVLESAKTQRSSNIKLAAFSCVWPDGSNIGATSQMSAPTRRLPRKERIIICASRTLNPPTSGTPVPMA